MKKFLILMSLLVFVGCDELGMEQSYPGHQRSNETCHIQWNIGYKNFNVDACEKHMANPKYKIGDKIKLAKLASNCRALVMKPGWSGQMNKPFYVYEVYCDDKPLYSGEAEYDVFDEDEVL